MHSLFHLKTYCIFSLPEKKVWIFGFWTSDATDLIFWRNVSFVPVFEVQSGDQGLNLQMEYLNTCQRY